MSTVKGILELSGFWKILTIELENDEKLKGLDTCLKVILENVGQTKSQFHGCDEKAP